MSETKKSNALIGAEHLESLRRWLWEAAAVPSRNGKVNISAISVATGINRQVLYRDEAQAIIAAASKEKGFGMPEQPARLASDEVPSWAKRRIKNLEEQVAVLKAETHDLRQKLRRFEHLEQHMIETGVLAR